MRNKTPKWLQNMYAQIEKKNKKRKQRQKEEGKERLNEQQY